MGRRGGSRLRVAPATQELGATPPSSESIAFLVPIPPPKLPNDSSLTPQAGLPHQVLSCTHRDKCRAWPLRHGRQACGSLGELRTWQTGNFLPAPWTRRRVALRHDSPSYCAEHFPMKSCAVASVSVCRGHGRGVWTGRRARVAAPCLGKGVRSSLAVRDERRGGNLIWLGLWRGTI